MHEAWLALEIVKLVEQAVAAQGHCRVHSVDITVGELSCVEPESLRFAINAISTRTILNESRINVVTQPGQLQCRHCQSRFFSRSLIALCPDCGKTGFNIIDGGDTQLTAVEIEEAQDV